jgi:hypothetical protein
MKIFYGIIAFLDGLIALDASMLHDDYAKGAFYLLLMGGAYWFSQED